MPAPSFSLSFDVFLSGLDAVPEEFGYTDVECLLKRRDVLVSNPAGKTQFPYTWQLDMLHITDLLSDTECVCFRSVAALFFLPELGLQLMISLVTDNPVILLKYIPMHKQYMYIFQF